MSTEALDPFNHNRIREEFAAAGDQAWDVPGLDDQGEHERQESEAPEPDLDRPRIEAHHIAQAAAGLGIDLIPLKDGRLVAPTPFDAARLREVSGNLAIADFERRTGAARAIRNLASEQVHEEMAGISGALAKVMADLAEFKAQRPQETSVDKKSVRQNSARRDSEDENDGLGLFTGSDYEKPVRKGKAGWRAAKVVLLLAGAVTAATYSEFHELDNQHRSATDIGQAVLDGSIQFVRDLNDFHP
jgi:hypothetical protein